jgi:hypothetical protein
MLPEGCGSYNLSLVLALGFDGAEPFWPWDRRYELTSKLRRRAELACAALESCEARCR